MPIYGSPSYAMGDEAQQIVASAATAPVTMAQAAAAKRELARMKRSLTRWLRYRAINDQVAAGAAAPSPILKYPLASPPAPTVARMKLALIRSDEAVLAQQLYQLLSEVFDPGQLPSPTGPDAVVALARIAVSGKLPGDGGSPVATGMSWVWPAVIVVGGVVLVLTTLIRSNADQAMEKERIECIKSGACTDYGFWLKVGGAAVAGWVVWEKFGVGTKVKSMVKRRRK